jgi:hypothetical protein
MRRHLLLYVLFATLSVGCTKSASPAQTGKAQSSTEGAISVVPATGPAGCTLCVKSNPLLIVDKDGAATGDVSLCNLKEAPAKLALSLSDFAMQQPRFSDALLATTRTVTAADGKPFPADSTVAKDQCVTVRLQLSKFGQGGLATGKLTNDGVDLIEVRAVRYDVPFNIKIDAPTPEKLDIAFTRGQKGKIGLVNEDGMGYRFHWRLDLGDEKREGSGTVEPRGRVELEVPLDDSRFSFLESGFLRSGSLNGRLILDYDPDPAFHAWPRPQKVYPLSARLHYHGTSYQRFLNSVAILAVLLLGILLSLSINFVWPMQSARVRLKQRLADLDGKLVGLGETVDPRLLSLLRVEKKRLRQELRNLLPVFPQTQIDLPKLEERIKLVGQRVCVTVDAGDLLDVLRVDEDRLSVHETDEVRNLCEEAFVVAGKPEPTVDELKTAEAVVRTATSILDQSGEKPTPERVDSLRSARQAVEALHTKYADSIKSWQSAEWTIAPAFDGAKLTAEMFAGWKEMFPPASGELDRQSYNRHSRAVRKAELLMEFAQLVETAGDPQVKAQRLARLRDLFDALRPGPGESIRRATAIVRQVEQNISSAEVQTAIAQAVPDTDMWIEKDPITPLPLQLVVFRVRFKQRGLDAAVARQDVWCVWKIDDEEQELLAGWLAGWFFEERPKWWHRPVKTWQLYQKEKNVRAIVPPPAPAGNPSISRIKVEATFPSLNKTLSTTIRVERTKSYVESRTLLALGSLAVTVLVVGFGLLAAAEEKIQSLDWISAFLAIVVLGYTADTVKNIITRS